MTRNLNAGQDRSVRAGNRLLDSGGLDGEGNTVLVAAGVVDAVVDPDRPRGLLKVVAVRAGDEVGTAVGKDAILVDLPACSLGVLRRRLNAGGETELALAHAREINVSLLARVANGVEPELVTVELESGLVVLLAVVTARVLVLELQRERLLGSLKVVEVDGRRGAESKTLEVGDLGGAASLGGSGDDASGDERSNEKSLDLHVGGCCCCCCWWWWW
jgi:hypothetical protein